jgi:hypothetical protein
MLLDPGDLTLLIDAGIGAGAEYLVTSSLALMIGYTRNWP